jgi:hypothetical protein
VDSLPATLPSFARVREIIGSITSEESLKIFCNSAWLMMLRKNFLWHPLITNMATVERNVVYLFVLIDLALVGLRHMSISTDVALELKPQLDGDMRFTCDGLTPTQLAMPRPNALDTRNMWIAMVQLATDQEPRLAFNWIHQLEQRCSELRLGDLETWSEQMWNPWIPLFHNPAHSFKARASYFHMRALQGVARAFLIQSIESCIPQKSPTRTPSTSGTSSPATAAAQQFGATPPMVPAFPHTFEFAKREQPPIIIIKDEQFVKKE